MANVLEIKISKEMMQECFEAAMKNIELQTGMTLVECAEKQVAKKIIAPGAGLGFLCPSCGKSRHWHDGDYCADCGQKLDWR